MTAVAHIPYSKHQSATALGKLGHPEGELTLTRAAAKHGVIQMVRGSKNSAVAVAHLCNADRHTRLMLI